MPIAVLYYKVSSESIRSAQQSGQIACWIEELPIIKQKQVKKLHQQKDQVLSLAGLQLLKIGLSKYFETTLSLQQVQFPKHSKPFFDDEIDFNISHSGEVVCCVISKTAKVGIDVELQREVSPAMLNRFFTVPNEVNTDKYAVDDKLTFFNLWTKNEAIIKAANSGSIYNMKEIQHEKNGGHYKDHFWSTYPINIISVNDDKEYTCHIACSEKFSTTKIQTIEIHNL